MLRMLVFAILIAAATPARSAPALDRDLAPLQFLAGDWVAVSKPGEGTGSFSFTPDVQGSILVRRNHSENPAANGRPAGIHDDLMVVFHEGSPAVVRAIYFDSEGHTIRYTADVAAAGQVTFVSDASAPGPRFRLSYASHRDGTLDGKFEVAPPGKPDAFATYFAWSAVARIR
jgi:hypothetical protein